MATTAELLDLARKRDANLESALRATFPAEALSKGTAIARLIERGLENQTTAE